MQNTRPEITQMLSKLTKQHINPHEDTRIYWAKEVTFDYSHSAKRVDYMRFKPLNNSVSGIEKGDFYCYEIKSSVEDFHSPNGHNFLGDFNYYVMPEDVYLVVEKEIPWIIGVYCPTPENTCLVCHKKAHRQDRTKPTSEMLLMMFRSAARDRNNHQS